MTVFAANATDKTQKLIDQMLKTDQFVKFKLQTKLNLSDNTVLIRLAFLNLINHLPDDDEVKKYKVALIRPGEFDDALKENLEITSC